MFNLRRGLTVFVVAAGVLAMMVTPTSAVSNNATAAPAGVRSESGSSDSRLNVRLLTAEQAKIVPMACWTTIRQPGGPGTTVYVDYHNCSNTSLSIAPYTTKVNNTGTYTYVRDCHPFAPNTSGTWTISPPK